MYEVVVSERATADLIAIEQWLIAEADPETAARYIDRVLSRIATLDRFPNRGTPRERLLPGHRSLSFERRILIVYAAQDRVVTVRRVLHAMRDFDELTI